MKYKSIIPEGWRYLKDEEIITEDCMCFGGLSNGETGWGRPPRWLVGQHYCDGWAGHPSLIAVEKSRGRDKI